MSEPARLLEYLPALPPTSRVRLELEGQRRGFPSASSFRQWCRRRGVPVHRDGHLLFVRPCDVDAKLRPDDEVDDDVAAAAAAITGVR